MATLKALGQQIITDPKLKPQDGKTFCNFAVAKVATAMGYNKFEGLMANQIIEKMQFDVRWTECTQDEALEHAMDGKLAVATYIDTPHGHVAVVAPAPKVQSAKWGGNAVQVYNVGKTVGLMGSNFAFATKPNFYKLD